MKTQQQSDLTLEARLDTQIARFGSRLAVGLTEHNQSLSHDITERLRFGREQALLKARGARAAQAQAVPSKVLLRAGNALALGGSGKSPRWLKLASFMPLILLALGLLLIQHSQLYEQIMAAADIDTALLSDQLPPAAYGDPGFSEFLSDDKE
jgi:hypothetical protein